MLFQLSVTEFNIINNYKKYTVSDCTDEEANIKKWQKHIDLNMVNIYDDVGITAIEDGPSHGNISLQSALTRGKRKIDTHDDDDEPIFIKSSYRKPKKTPVEVKLEKND